MTATRRRTLVAGVGNVFLGDDGFGVEVVRRLASERLPVEVHVEDFGIRGVHLAYELANGYDLLILVDAAPRGDAPGTVYVIEPDPDAVNPLDPHAAGGAVADAHDMTPDAVFSLMKTLGGHVEHAYVVGCEPAHTGEGIGLSEPVAAAVPAAVTRVLQLLRAPARRPERT